MACCNNKLKSAPTDRHKFHPDYRKSALTEKFYARHECLVAEHTPKVKEYMDAIQKVWDFDARCHYRLPRYTNQTYGWLRGETINRYERCELKVVNHPLIQQACKNLLRQPGMANHMDKGYCICKEARAADKWKIV